MRTIAHDYARKRNAPHDWFDAKLVAVTDDDTPPADRPLTTGDRMRAARMLRDLSLDQLAALTPRGIGRTKLSAWESGSEEPLQWHLDEIARVVGVGPGWWTLDFSGLGLPPYIDEVSLMRDVEQRLAEQSAKFTELLDRFAMPAADDGDT